MSDDVVRVIIDEQPHSGQWNMACDETLLISACDNNICTLRWYLWEEATLSLGYFQKFEQSQKFVQSQKIEQGQEVDKYNFPQGWHDLPRVKRLSGGGAILHHHEITYSCCLPATHPMANHPAMLYETIHQNIISSLQSEGINLSLRGEGNTSRDDAFLCFLRGDKNDVMCGEHKVLGSAQRRRRGAILQHGSLLLKQSKWATLLPGLLDLNEIGHITQRELMQKLAQKTSTIVGKPLFEESPNDSEIKTLKHLIQTRYQHLDWSTKK